MYILLYTLIIIVVIFFILAMAAPKNYLIKRSMSINQPRPAVYEYLRHTKNQNIWSPWQKRDPRMKQTFTGTDGEVGFISHWESDHKQVGHGEQEIVSLEPNKKINTALRFLKPWKSESIGFFDLEDASNGGTEVTWGFYGIHKIPINIMMLFFNMDKAVGKDFEEGLSELKKVLEN